MQESKSCALPLGDSPIINNTKLCNSARPYKKRGWVKGLEPLASRATIWRANQLRHTHHHSETRSVDARYSFIKRLRFSVPKGIRTPDPRLRRPLLYPAELWTQKRVMGIEPTYPAWKAGVLPLNYTRILNNNMIILL